MNNFVLLVVVILIALALVAVALGIAEENHGCSSR